MPELLEHSRTILDVAKTKAIKTFSRISILELYMHICMNQ